MHAIKDSPQALHRLRQRQRVNDSPGLAEKFSEIGSLNLELSYLDSEGSPMSALKYSMNVQHAKSVVSFPCQSGNCFDGDFDLSAALSKAIRNHRKTAEGEIRCEGVRPTPNDGRQPCHNLLRYKISLGYLS